MSVSRSRAFRCARPHDRALAPTRAFGNAPTIHRPAAGDRLAITRGMPKPNDDQRRPQSDRTQRDSPVPEDKRHPPDGNPGDDQIEHMPGHGTRRGDQGGRKASAREARPRFEGFADEHGTMFV
jgi:hypothetical protein